MANAGKRMGKGLFVDADGKDRFGLAAKMPAVLKEGMPSFAGDQLHAAQSDGDLLVLLQEGGGVIRIIGERIAGHIGEEVHACEPIELARPRQFTPAQMVSSAGNALQLG